MVNIRTALAAAIVPLLTGSELGYSSDQIFAENSPRPDSLDPWIQLWFKPGKATAFTLGPGGLDLLPGVMLVNFHLALDTGSAEGIKVAGTFRDAFPAGKRLIFNGQDTHIVNCDANLSRVVDTWYRADISIYWKAYLTRGAV